MSITMTVVDGTHRPDLYVEIELDGNPVAEVFVADRRLIVEVLYPFDGSWEAPLEELVNAFEKARIALEKMGLDVQ